MSIDLLVRQYGENLDPNTLQFPPAHTLLNPAVQATLYDRMFNEATVWPQPPPPYQTRVLKMMLSRMENAISDPEEDEISDALVEKYSTLISHPKPTDPLHQAQQLTYITYTAPSPFPGTPDHPARTILTSENRSLILAGGTTGFRTWEAALHLGTYLSTTTAGAALVRDKRVVELGAGTGFVSLFCAKFLRPRRVVATDREQALIDCMVGCAGRNGVAACSSSSSSSALSSSRSSSCGGDDGDRKVFEAGIWEWGTPLRRPGSVDEEGTATDETHSATEIFDVALGADLIYDTDLIPLLVSTIHTLFTTHQIKEFVISATLRNKDTFQAFLDACETSRLKAERIAFESPAPEQQTGFFHSTLIPISMYRITK